MTKNFDAVIRRYAQKYGISFRDAASMLGKRNAKAKKPIKPKKPVQTNLDFFDPPTPTYGTGI